MKGQLQYPKKGSKPQGNDEVKELVRKPARINERSHWMEEAMQELIDAQDKPEEEFEDFIWDGVS